MIGLICPAGIADPLAGNVGALDGLAGTLMMPGLTPVSDLAMLFSKRKDPRVAGLEGEAG